MSKNLISYLRQLRYIDEQDAQRIMDICDEKNVKRGEWLSKTGMVSRKLYFIDEGILKITTPHSDGEDLTYYFMEENQFMGFLYSMYDNVPTLQGLQAATDVRLSVLDKDKLFELYSDLEYLKDLIDRIARNSIAEMIHIKNSYLSGNSLEKYLLFLKNQPQVALRAMQIDISSYLGITPQSLSRIRKQMSRSGSSIRNL
jgi:CRP-like cAMP-binding protein